MLERKKGISVMIRNRDEGITLALALECARQIGDQIVFIDNNSIDSSLFIAEEFKKKHKLDTMVIEKYDLNVQHNKSTLADYYNFALSFCDREWVIKWDGDLFAEPWLCEKIRNTILAETDDSVQGFYLTNTILCRDKKNVYIGQGGECAIFRNIPGRVYIADISCEGLEALIHQRKLFMKGDLFKDFIWHCRFKSPKNFVRSRLFYFYLGDKVEGFFDDYVTKRLEGTTYEELEMVFLRDAIKPYDPELHEGRPIPPELANLKYY
jgi:glycosyltransferase involved in cell wall biosynthesis